MHECLKEEFLGRVSEFMEGMKGLKATLFTVSIAILIQVSTFLYLWGGLTTTVGYQGKALDKICEKLDKVKVIGYVYAENGVSK